MSGPRTLSLALLLCLAVGSPAPAQPTNPFIFFHVFSQQDIGSAAAPYHSDFQGIAGALGSGWFHAMSLNDLGMVTTDYSLLAGGQATFTGSINHGGIEVGGNISLTGVNVDGHVSSGGDVSGDGGTIDGDIRATGTIDLRNFTVTGTTQSGVPFVPSIDLDAAGAFLVEKSAFFATWATTGDPILGGQIVFEAGSFVNVFEVAAADLAAAWGVAIHGPATAAVIINVTGTGAALTDMDWVVDPAIDLEGVLVNFPEAATLEIHGVAVLGNILAPHAATHFPAGLVVGGLWVGDLQGGGQVNYGRFIEPDQPVPATATTWGGVKARF